MIKQLVYKILQLYFFLSKSKKIGYQKKLSMGFGSYIFTWNRKTKNGKGPTG